MTPFENKKNRTIAGAAFVNRDQVLCGGDYGRIAVTMMQITMSFVS